MQDAVIGTKSYSWLAMLGTLFAVSAARAQHDADEKPSAAAPANPEFTSDLLRFVEDNLPVQNASQNRFEAQCYEQMLLHARRLPADLLRQRASSRVNFAHLFGDDRARYRGKLVHISGRLRMLRQFELPETLAGLDTGLMALYEAWIFDDHFGDNPYCVIFSELPAGVQPGESLNRAVEADAFFFKRYRYAAKDGWRDAPLLIGRSIRLDSEPPARSSSSIWELPAKTMGLVVTAVAAALAACGGLVWWFRRADRRTRRELNSILRDAKAAPADWEK